MTDPTKTPAGWHDDGSGNLRYWDGNGWTEHTAPGPSSTSGDPVVAQADTTTATDATMASTSVAADAPQHTWSFDELTSTQPVQPYSTGAYGQEAPPAGAPFTEPSNPKPHVLGIIALVVATIGFVFGCIPGALIVGWVLLPIALVLSIAALFLKGAKWPAITGLVVSIVGAMVATVVYFVFVSTAITDAMTEAFDQFDEVIAEASEAAEAPDDLDESASQPAPDALGTLSFGETNVWENGVQLSVSAPEPYTPSEAAVGADLPDNLVFTITIRNNSSENLEPSPFPQLSSGGQEAGQIFDVMADGQSVSVPPTTVVLPGQSVSWRAAWSVADPNALTMQVAPNFEYEDAIFTNIQ